MTTFKRLLQYLKPYHKWLPETILYSLLAAIFGSLIYLLLMSVLELLFKKDAELILVAMPSFSFTASYFTQLFNHYYTAIALQHGKFFSLVFICGILFLSALLANVFRYLLARLVIKLRLRIIYELRSELFNKSLNQSLHFYQRTNKGNLLATVINEVNEVETSLVTTIQTVIKDPIQIIISFIILLNISVKLTLFTLIFIPITGFIISRITQPLKKVSSLNMTVLTHLVQIVEESFGGIKVIQGFSAENFVKNKFNALSNNFTKTSKKMSGLRELASPLSETLGILAVLLLVLFGAYLIFYKVDTTLTGDKFLGYIAMYYTIVQPMKALATTPTNFQRGIVGAEKIFSLLDEAIEIKNSPNALALTGFNNQLSFNNVSFKYKDSNVLNQINLTIPKGKTIALVGESGSGKTTISDLALRFYNPHIGQVEIDNVDIKNYTIESYRNLFAVVTQDAILFNDTIKNNILFGQANVSDIDLIAAAKAANAYNFIMQSEHGFNTNVGDRGMKLSGGQKQRITIARAILKNPAILILDEATSALDTESEKLVQEAINKLITNRTCLIIAHRLSTIKHADQIIVLNNGSIVEQGSHQQLVTQNGYYNKLVLMQSVK